MIKNSKLASSIRKRLAEIPAEIDQHLRVVLQHRKLFKGYVYRSVRRCGKPSCKCTRGELHEVWVAAVEIQGRKTTRSVAPEARNRLVRMAENYRRFRAAQRALRRSFSEVMELTRQLEALMCQEPSRALATQERKRSRRRDR